MNPSRRELLTRYGPAAALMWTVLRSDRALAQTAFPKRFVTFFSSSGVMQSTFWPKGNPGSAASGSYSVDGTSLAPLKSLLPDLIIPRGIQIDRGPGDSHDAGSVAILTGDYLRATEVNSRPFAYGQSLDQFLSKRMSTGTAEPYLLQGTRLQVNRISKYISFDSQGLPLEYAQDPYSLYEKIFRTVVTQCTGDQTAAEQLEAVRFKRKSVLDVIRPQVVQMQSAVGLSSAERQKLARMEESIRSVERRLDTLGGPQGQTSPNCAPIKAAMETGTRISNTDANFPRLLTLHMDLLALALELDITRVVTLSLSLGGSGGAPMNWLKWNDAGTLRAIDASHHNVTHGEQRGVANYQEKLKVIDPWNFSQFGYLVSALKRIQEGPGTLLDNSIVWYASDVGDGNNHSKTNMPFIIAGRGGGTIQTGRYIQYSNSPRHQRLLLTFIHKLGFTTVNAFGRAGLSDGGDLF